MELDVVRGDWCVIEYTVTDAVDADGNRLSSLAGLSWEFQAREFPASPTVLFALTSANGQIVVNGFTVKVKIAGTHTASLAGKRIFCDLQATDGQGRQTTVFVQGSPYIVLNVLQDVTR